MDPLYVAGVVTAAAAALGAIGWAARTLWLAARRVADLHDDWRGEEARPGVPRRPGVMERLADIERELHPNAGVSLRDAVDLLSSRVDEHLRSHATPVQVNVGTTPVVPSEGG